MTDWIIAIIGWIAMYAFALSVTWKWIRHKGESARELGPILLALQCAPFINLLWAMYFLWDVYDDKGFLKN